MKYLYKIDFLGVHIEEQKGRLFSLREFNIVEEDTYGYQYIDSSEIRRQIHKNDVYSRTSHERVRFDRFSYSSTQYAESLEIALLILEKKVTAYKAHLRLIIDTQRKAIKYVKSKRFTNGVEEMIASVLRAMEDLKTGSIQSQIGVRVSLRYNHSKPKKVYRNFSMERIGTNGELRESLKAIGGLGIEDFKVMKSIDPYLAITFSTRIDHVPMEEIREEFKDIEKFFIESVMRHVVKVEAETLAILEKDSLALVEEYYLEE